MTDQTAGPRIVHNETEHRYEVWSGDKRAGFAAYEQKGDQLVFTHTEIDEAFAGQGLGKVLAAGALDDVVAQGQVIVPVCPFIAAYVKKNQQYDEHVKWLGE